MKVSLAPGVDAVCRGRHPCFVVDVATAEARLAAKAGRP